MRVNIANYIYTDLLKRFSAQNDKIIDSDVIDILVSKWANREYLAPDSSLKLHHKQSIKPPHLM